MGPASETAAPSAAFWGNLAGALLVLKLLGLVLDPQPQFFLGDSESYIHSALTDGVPTDRSYWYSVLIQTIVGETRSLTPLLIAQASFGAASALLGAFWAHVVFRPSRPTLGLVALLCALDPVQVLYERYVMTESPTLFALALMLVCLAFVIRRGSWLWMLPSVLAATAVVALRMSLLPAVLVSLAVTPALASVARSMNLRRTLLAYGVAALALPPCLHLNAAIKSGQSVLAAWSPLLLAEDFPERVQGERFLRGIDLRGGGFFTREINLFRRDGLIQRLKDEVPDLDTRDRLARETALRVARRDPLGVAGLALRTYGNMWDRNYRLRLMRWDIGQNPLSDEFRETLASEFHLVAEELPRPTISSRLYLSLGSWTAIASLCAPVLLCAAAFSRRRPEVAALMLLSIAGASVLATISLFATLPVVRYLHPLGWMLLAGCLPPLMGGWQASLRGKRAREGRA